MWGRGESENESICSSVGPSCFVTLYLNFLLPKSHTVPSMDRGRTRKALQGRKSLPLRSNQETKVSSVGIGETRRPNWLGA